MGDELAELGWRRAEVGSAADELLLDSGVDSACDPEEALLAPADVDWEPDGLR
jgi:hypothetical protein